MLRDWSGKYAPLFLPIGCKTETTHVLFARVYAHFTERSCFYFEFSLTPAGIFPCSDSPFWLLWLWFYYNRKPLYTTKLELLTLNTAGRATSGNAIECACIEKNSNSNSKIWSITASWEEKKACVIKGDKWGSPQIYMCQAPKGNIFGLTPWPARPNLTWHSIIWPSFFIFLRFFFNLAACEAVVFCKAY